MEKLFLEKCRDDARQAALQAWEKIKHFYQGKFEIYEKENDGPATEADIMADHFIVDFLKKRYPSEQFGYLSEETQQGDERLGKPFCWIIDPIDGTRDFIEGSEDFCIQIGLAGSDKEGEEFLTPLVGVVYQPTTGLLYQSAKGVGANVENLNTGEKRKLKVTTQCKLTSSTVVYTRSHFGKRLQLSLQALEPKKERKKGSYGIKVMDVANATSDYYLNTGVKHCKEWDTLAPHAILLEAGGTLTDISGKPILYNKKDVYVYGGSIASNSILHQAITDKLRNVDHLWKD